MAIGDALVELGLRKGADEISDTAYEAATKLLLDAIGCALGGYDAPGVCEVYEQMNDWGGKPEASPLFSTHKLPAPSAIFVNSAMIHALDLDDVYLPAVALHITSVVVPCVLAAAEMTHASGRDTLAALTMGIEVAGRLGIVARQHRRHDGFLPTSLDCGFGAVVAAARLLGMSGEATVHAMGLNYAQISGNRQALLDSSLTKRIQPGFAARSAWWAVSLARRGVTGPAHWLEGEAGYFKIYLNGEDPSIDSLVRPKPWFEVENTAVKRYPRCGACHPSQAAAELLAKESKLNPTEIRAVELFGPYLEGGIVGRPFKLGSNPQVDAQFSVAYAVALALVKGRAELSDYTNEAVLANGQLSDLAADMRFVDVPEDVPTQLMDLPPDYPDYSVFPYGLVVHLQDGTRLVRARCPAQTFGPASCGWSDVKAKFRDCAAFSGLCDREETQIILDRVCELKEAPDLSLLFNALSSMRARRGVDA